MRRFHCDACGGEVFFDSTSCGRCGSALGYVLARDEVLASDGETAVADGLARCANARLAGCTWLTTLPSGLCESCALTRTRPNDDDADGLRLLPLAEESKRHLVRDLARLDLPIDGLVPGRGEPDPSRAPLRFDMLSSVDESVTIGHANGIVTIDLAEGDHSHRERVRQQRAEPYRTMLGHVRHESGHYVEWQVVEGTDRIDEARALFGDERADYREAIDRHYADGPPDGWRERYLSAYATMHPYEDFAETFAHLLHIRDALETAEAFGLVEPAAPDASVRDVVVGTWLPFATAMNVVNRSLGRRDLYPFVLPDPVIEKLAFVDSLRRPTSH